MNKLTVMVACDEKLCSLFLRDLRIAFVAEVMHVKCYECSLFSSSMVYYYRF